LVLHPPEGLSRFGEYHFVSYGVNEGLAHRFVSTLIKTRSGDYFVGTARGISRINPAGKGARFTPMRRSMRPRKTRVTPCRSRGAAKYGTRLGSRIFEWKE
jgi:hypothetical protein